MKQNKETLKKHFETGDKPTQQQYADLIDSYIDAKQPAGEANRRFVIDEAGEVSVALDKKGGDTIIKVFDLSSLHVVDSVSYELAHNFNVKTHVRVDVLSGDGYLDAPLSTSLQKKVVLDNAGVITYGANLLEFSGWEIPANELSSHKLLIEYIPN
ncbi:hypothetical protein [uncultured Tenacibaculum sp.]|uniref:hypothetical protein n=1 Tax=uncultured Tenacibaculum sp. TaxID=174713 RepID=UPI002612046A|nr:hypothetical protein [uncultured Tenacibaculum sp.]